MLNKVLHLQVDLMVCSHCWIQRPIKMACFELDVGVHTAQRQIPTRDLHWAFMSVCLNVEQCEYTTRISKRFTSFGKGNNK